MARDWSLHGAPRAPQGVTSGLLCSLHVFTTHHHPTLPLTTANSRVELCWGLAKEISEDKVLFSTTEAIHLGSVVDSRGLRRP